MIDTKIKWTPMGAIVATANEEDLTESEWKAIFWNIHASVERSDRPLQSQRGNKFDLRKGSHNSRKEWRR